MRRKRRKIRSAVEFESLSRTDTTQYLTDSIAEYWIEKRYSNHIELGLNKRGNLRADIWALNTKCNVVITEIKSCWADLSSDKKWHNYFEYCHKLYFGISEHFYLSHGEKIRKKIGDSGAGIIVVSPSGKSKVVKPAKTNIVSNKILSRVLIHAAWRGGKFR